MAGMFKSILVVVTAGAMSTVSLAQSKTKTGGDSLEPYRLFMEKCTAYKQLPLQLEMELQSQTNFQTAEADTGTTAGRFMLQPGFTYIRFGELEQLVTDSAALLVSEKLKQMFFFADPAMVAATTKAFAALGTPQFNLTDLADKYTIVADTLKAPATVVLRARRQIPTTGLPVDQIELYYNSLTAQPERLITLKRTLIPISKEDYQTLSGKAATPQLVEVGDQHFYLLKEQAVTFVYKSIRHLANVPAPAVISDRIKKTGDGQYIGVNHYKDYAITLN